MTEETDEQRLHRLSRDQTGKPLPKRFYKLVTVTEDHSILLDGRVVKTPMKQLLRLPSAALAKAVAEEWQAQETFINPRRMPLTKLVNTALDRATAERDSVLREIVEYAGSDLVCYRAESPVELVAKQAAAWDPVLNWALVRLDAHFVTAQGIVHKAQSAASLAAIEKHVARFDSYNLTAAFMLTTLTGSTLLSLMVMDHAIDGAFAWNAVHVDDDYQIALWGEDDEAMRRRAGRRREFEAMVRFLELLDAN
jgi:chaperone required for assembly of F1-ATPase